jgi:hypothetical protein
MFQDGPEGSLRKPAADAASLNEIFAGNYPRMFVVERSVQCHTPWPSAQDDQSPSLLRLPWAALPKHACWKYGAHYSKHVSQPIQLATFKCTVLSTDVIASHGLLCQRNSSTAHGQYSHGQYSGRQHCRSMIMPMTRTGYCPSIHMSGKHKTSLSHRCVWYHTYVLRRLHA